MNRIFKLIRGEKIGAWLFLDYKEKYLSWTENIYIDDADKLDLKNIFDDEHEIKERFYKD